MIWQVSIDSVLYWVGLILLGMIELFGLLVGSFILVKLVCGFELSRCRLLVIFIRVIVRFFRVLERMISGLWLVRVVNLFGVVMKGRFDLVVIFVVMVLVKFFGVLSLVFIVVLFWVNWQIVGSVVWMVCLVQLSWVMKVESFWLKVIGVVFIRWVCLVLIRLVCCVDCLVRFLESLVMVGSNCLCMVLVVVMCMVVGKLLLEFCVWLMWLLGCIGDLLLCGLLVSLLVWLVIILLMFMLVWVLLLVCQIISGKCLLWWFVRILLVVCLINWVIFGGSLLRWLLICVVVFLISVRVWIMVSGMCWLLMVKFFSECWVWVFQQVLLGIFMVFRLLVLVWFMSVFQGVYLVVQVFVFVLGFVVVVFLWVFFVVLWVGNRLFVVGVISVCGLN